MRRVDAVDRVVRDDARRGVDDPLRRVGCPGSTSQSVLDCVTPSSRDIEPVRVPVADGPCWLNTCAGDAGVAGVPPLRHMAVAMTHAWDLDALRVRLVDQRLQRIEGKGATPVDPCAARTRGCRSSPRANSLHDDRVQVRGLVPDDDRIDARRIEQVVAEGVDPVRAELAPRRRRAIELRALRLLGSQQVPVRRRVPARPSSLPSNDEEPRVSRAGDIWSFLLIA